MSFRRSAIVNQKTLYLSLLILTFIVTVSYLVISLRGDKSMPSGELPAEVFKYQNFNDLKFRFNAVQEIALSDTKDSSRERNANERITIAGHILQFKEHSTSPSVTAGGGVSDARNGTDASLRRNSNSMTYNSSNQESPTKNLIRIQKQPRFAEYQDEKRCSSYKPSKGFQTDLFCLQDSDASMIFRSAKYGLCYINGSKPADERNLCECVEGWHGQHCSMPSMVETSNYPYEYGVSVNDIPRRIIYAFPFTFEFEMFEARLKEFEDLVDVYVILESNFTAMGKPKPRYLRQNLEQEYMQNYQHKMLVIHMNQYPKKAHQNGWVIDERFRSFLGEQVFKRIPNLRPDDIFIISDADELPRREALFFLKYHHGYPEPVGFNLRHNVFGFYWVGDDLTSHVFGACSISMLMEVFRSNPYRLRSATKHMERNGRAVEFFKLKKGGRVHEWSFGTKELPAGWHCSWCFQPELIRLKMVSAHASDVPRWGNDPRKTNIEYISKLIHNGTWFDDKTSLIPITDSHNISYAPKHMMEYRKKYEFLLKLPS